MGVKGKLQAEVDIKSSGDSFHELWGCKPHHVSTISNDIIHGCDLHEGEFGQIGSVLQFEYTIDGKKSVVKMVLEFIDEEKKTLRLKAIEGDILEEYKCLTSSIHVIPKGEFDAIMWEIDFERFDDYGPYPTNLMDAAIKMTRDIEAHHLNECE